MADSVDPIVIPIQTDDKDSLMSIMQVQAAIGDLSSELNALKRQSESPMADYTRDFNQQIRFAEQGLTRLLDLRKRVDSATSTSDKTRTTKVFEDEYKRMETVVDDLKQSMSTSKALFSSFSDGLEKEFTEGIKSFAPRIKQAFRQMADSITKSSGTRGDDSLIELFQHSDVYKNTMKSLQNRNASVFSDSNMRAYLRSIMPTAIPQYDRNKYVDWAKNEYVSKTVREMLPKAFGNIQLSGQKTYVPFQQKSKGLTSTETTALQKLIKDNPYVANELEQAGIMRRYNGTAYYNPNTKRANVDAFAGLIASMFETGARGGPSSGITNIEDPAFQSKILRKTNMYMNNSMRVASTLAEAFPWLNPQHMEVPQNLGFIPSVNGTPGNWRTLGTYKAKPRQSAMEFYEFGLDELGADGAISFKDGKARYTRVNNSLMQSALSSRTGATKFSHNGFNNNEVYLSLPVEELSNYETTPERRKELQAQIARAIGQTPTIGGYQYRFGGFTPTHAVFERSDLYDQLPANFFMNGEDRRTFSSFKDFSKALEATRKLRTEGEDIRTLYGSDLSKANVVVARMKDITGLDGQNWIDSTLVPESFQGRNFGGKATFSKVDISSLWQQYPQLVDKTTGNLVLPSGGVNGGQLVIPRGTSVIEDIENIKTKHQYQGIFDDQTKSAAEIQAAINEARTQEIRTNGIFAKTTAEAASTNPRYISSQAAGTMHFGPEARRYFNNVFLHELASLEDVGSVKELLFSGDDPLSRMVQSDEGFLNSQEARERIDEYRQSLFTHAGKGDILIPRGSANYAMISAWLPDVMARLIPEDQLTDEQKSWRLADINKKTGLIAGSGTESEDIISKVAYFASKADELGLYRNPATASGNLKLSNAAIDKNMQSIAEALGVDTSALYVDPKSIILGLMQGADEDGDTAFVTALKGNKEFGDVMSNVLIDTATAYKNMRELGNRTDEQQKAIRELHTLAIDKGKSEFSLDNLDDIADWWVGSKLAGMRMGAANAVSVGARQFRPSQMMARAILDAESHYDVDSTGLLKSAQEWQTTQDEKNVLFKGAPFFQIANWAKKSVTEAIDNQGKPITIFDQDAFNKRAIDKVNFASINDSHALLAEYSNYMAHLMNPDAKSEFDWNSIFGALPEIDTNTETGKLTARLRELKQGRLNNEFLFFDDDVVDELIALRRNAYGEIQKEVLADNNIQNKQFEINKRLSAAGGDVVNNLLQFGLTRRNIEANPSIKQDFDFLQSLTEGTGTNLFAKAKDYSISYDGPTTYSGFLQQKKTSIDQQIKQAEIQREEKQQKLQELEQLVYEDPGYVEDQQSYQQEIQSLNDQISSLQQQKETVNKQQGYNEMYEAVQAEYNRLISDSGQFSSELFKSVMQKQNKIDGVSRAKTFYDSQHGIARYYTKQINDFLMKAPTSMLTDEQNANLLKRVQRINTNVDKEFAAKAILNAQSLAEDLEQKAAPAGGIWGQQEQQLEAYLDKMKEAEEYKKILLGLAADPNVDKQSQDDFKKAADKVDEYLKHASEQYDKYKEKLTLNNEIMEAQRIERENAQIDQFVLRGQQMSFSKSGVARNDFMARVKQQQLQTVSQYASYISSGEGMLSELKKKHLDQAVGSKEYIATANNIEKLSAALQNARVEMKSFEGASGLAKIALANLGQVTQGIIKNFGRRMFQQATQEARRFVQEFDKDMTTIQMITLKSDSEIRKLGQNLIQKAVDMKASVSETTSAAGELYRQGLSDEEVDTRLEDVIKFSKVAGIKTTEASKIITTALQNNLVASSEEAMDALVALGDSAATTASEIAKGMQKTAASAKQAKMSYGELVTLLTIGTSKTQLGGSAIGSALQTLIYRLYKVGNNEGFEDENGNFIAETNTTKALGRLGIDIYDDNKNFRGPYQILTELAQKWEIADDTTQSLILSTLGAGRQRSNVATLIQGLSEDGGELAKNYLNLAENSSGITDSKYKEYLDSLEASITNVKTSFDQLIATFNAGSTASGILDLIAKMIQGFTAVNETLGAAPALITSIGLAAAGVIALFKLNPVSAWITVATAGIATVVSLVGNAIKYAKENTPEKIEEREQQKLIEDYNKRASNTKNSISSYTSIISETRRLGEEYEKLGDKMNEADHDRFVFGLKTIIGIFPELGSGITSVTELLERWKEVVDGAGNSVNDFKDKSIAVLNKEAYATYDKIDKDVQDQISEINSSIVDPNNYKGTINGTVGSRTGTWTGLADLGKQLGYNSERSVLDAMFEHGSEIYDDFSIIDPKTFINNFGSQVVKDFYNQIANGTYDGSISDFSDIMKNQFGLDPEDYYATYKLNQEDWIKKYVSADVTKDQIESLKNNPLIQQSYDAYLSNDAYDLADYFYNEIYRDIEQQMLNHVAPGFDFNNFLDNEAWGFIRAYGNTSKIQQQDSMTTYLALRANKEGYVKNQDYQFENIEDKNAYKDLLEFLYNQGIIDVKHNFADTESFIAAFENGFEDLGDDIVLEYVDAIQTQFEYYKSNSGLSVFEEYMQQQAEKVQAIWDQALMDYIKNNPNTLISDSIDTPVINGIFNKIKADHEGVKPEDYINRDVLPGLIEQEIFAWMTNRSEWESKYTNASDYAYQFNEQGYRTLEDVYKAIESYAKETNQDATKVKNEWERGSTGGLLSNIIKGIDAYNAAKEDKSIADSVFKSINQLGISSFDELFERSSEIPELRNLLQNENMGAFFKDFIVENEEGEQMLNGSKEAFQAFLVALASLTTAYSDAAKMLLPDMADQAKEFMKDKNPAYYDSFSSIVGSSLANKYNLGMEISPFEQSYMETLINNARYGTTGLTDLQRYEGVNNIMDMVNAGTFDMRSMDSGMLNAYTSGSSYMNNYLRDYQILKDAGKDIGKLNDLDPTTDAFKEYDKALKDAGSSAKSCLENQKQLNKELSSAGVQAANEFGDRTKEVASIIESLSGSSEEAAAEQQKLNKMLSSVASNQFWRNKWKSGDRSDDTLKAIASMLNIDSDQMGTISEKLINSMLDSLENLDLSGLQSYADALSVMITDTLQSAIDADPIALQTAGIDVTSGPVNLNFTQALQQLSAFLTDAQKALIQQMVNWGVDGNVQLYTDEGGNIHAKINVTSLGRGRGGGTLTRSSGGSGGGGGGGGSSHEKSPAEKLTEAIKNRQSIWDHQLKMVQYREQYYEEDSQLGNYGRMIEAENRIREDMGRALEENLEQLKAELAQTSMNTEDWYKLRDAILEAEEAIEDNNNAIASNIKKLKENEYNINKLRINLEDIVREEIKRRIQEQRDMVEGAASLEDTILDIIRERYREEWKLIEEDVDKKKQALNEEKNVINERLQARKRAEDSAAKYEQLTEYKKQLALIQMDRTRTKEAAALRKKIAELQVDIGWDIAEEEANNQVNQIDEQINAYDEYIKFGGEALDKFLENANNLAEEVKTVMNMNHDELIDWLSTYSQDFQNALVNSQEAMIYSWSDQFKQANGIVETFNEEVEKILKNQDTYIEYMKQSSEYLNATKAAQENLVTDWLDAYDEWYRAQDHSAVYYHSDNGYNSSGYVEDSGNYGGSYDGGGYYGGDYSSTPETLDVTIGKEDKPTAQEETKTQNMYRSRWTNKRGQYYVATGATQGEAHANVKQKVINAGYNMNDGAVTTDVITANGDLVRRISYLKIGYRGKYGYGANYSYALNQLKKQLNQTEINAISNNPDYLSISSVTEIPTVQSNTSSSNKNSNSSSSSTSTSTSSSNSSYNSNTSSNSNSNYSNTSSNSNYLNTSSNSNSSSQTSYKFTSWALQYPGYTQKSWRNVKTNNFPEIQRAAQKALIAMNSKNSNIKVGTLWWKDANGYENKWGIIDMTTRYKKGGLVDYTGPAWVDGTPSEPEAFLSAPDTKMIRELIDYLHYVRTPSMTRFDTSNIYNNSNGSSIENVNVVINGADFGENADYELIARRVGQEFAKELEKQGFSTARYRL